MICMPSRSCLTSSGVVPCVAFQYWDDTTGMLEMVKYLFSRSKAALAPPRRQLTMAAPGLYANAMDFPKNSRSRRCAERAVRAGIVDGRTDHHAIGLLGRVDTRVHGIVVEDAVAGLEAFAAPDTGPDSLVPDMEEAGLDALPSRAPRRLRRAKCRCSPSRAGSR